MIETLRKCGECHEEIVLERERTLFYKKHYYHVDCFARNRVGKPKPDSRKERFTDEEASEYAERLFLETRPEVDYQVDRNHFYKWLQRTYGLVSLPSYFCQKAEQVVAGTWKDMDYGIPFRDLHDMWKRKLDYFNQVFASNRAKGKGFDDNASRLNYELSILINKYSAYLTWKETQRKQRENAASFSSTPLMASVRRGQTPEASDAGDISAYLEEI